MTTHPARSLPGLPISIHTPLAGSDRPPRFKTEEERRFQSTLPLRGVTAYYAHNILVRRISIHTPLAGSDAASFSISSIPAEFQSTLPLRGVTNCIRLPGRAEIFQSTLPLRGVTIFLELGLVGKAISIHTPLAGSDLRLLRRRLHPSNFNPHSPCGE